jgi:phospholipid transport system substrate-binding protein
LSRLALGTHWQERTPEDRDHFIQTFSGIIEEQNFDSFVQYYREGKITYESAERDGNATVVVAKVPLQREEIEIVYKLHQVQKAWRVYDIVIDGVSTAEGNRRRYARYIEKKGYEKLIAQLDKQLARLRQTRN